MLALGFSEAPAAIATPRGESSIRYRTTRKSPDVESGCIPPAGMNTIVMRAPANPRRMPRSNRTPCEMFSFWVSSFTTSMMG